MICLSNFKLQSNRICPNSLWGPRSKIKNTELNNELILCSNFPQFVVGSKEQETEAVSEKEMRLAEEFWHCVSLCPLADSPHNPFHSQSTHRSTLSPPPTGGALVLGGICVTNFTLSSLPTRCFTVYFLCLSVRCMDKRHGVKSVGEMMGLLPLATWIPTQ